MPRNITVTFADGTSHTYQNAPDDVTPDAVQTRAEKQFAKTVKGIDGGAKVAEVAQPAETSIAEKVSSAVKPVTDFVNNAQLGALRGASRIGTTLQWPTDALQDYMSPRAEGQPSRHQERIASIEAALPKLGADKESAAYQSGDMAAQLAGTAGAGPALGGMAKAAGAAAPIVNSLSSAGFTTGSKAVGAVPKAIDAVVRAGGGAATGGAAAGLVDPANAGMGAVVGGVAPGALQVAGNLAGKAGNAAASVVQKAAGGATPEVAKLAQRAKELGIDIPADRLIDSKPLNAVAAGLNYVPFSGRSATEERMSEQMNKALSRTFGQNSPNVTMGLRKANDSLGAQFDHTLKNNGVNFDKQLFQDTADVYNKAEAELGADLLKPIKAQLDTLYEKGQSGVIDGQAAYNIKRELDRIGRGNTPTAFHALELKGALMDALNRSLGPAKAEAFATTRKQYGNMLALEKLAKNGVDGEISAARLANMRNINNPELQELADIAAQFVKPREGQHGAAQRALVGAATFGMGGLPGLAAGAITGRAANASLNNQGLKNLMLGQTGNPSPLVELLKKPETQKSLLRSLPVTSSQ